MTRSTFRRSVTNSAFKGYINGGKTVKAISGMLLILFMILSLAATTRIGAAQDEIQIGVNPNVLRPVNGKLTQTQSIAVYAQTCTTGIDFSPLNENGKYRYTLSATGGLTLSDAKNGKCLVQSTLTIDPSLSAGTYHVILLHDDKPVGDAELAVLDAAAGAIPPGLVPQVDVLWTVMSKKIATDVFGNRVGKRFYCIEVKIGNNSGHALQIAGIGFENDDVLGMKVKQANASYASTRAVLQREETLSRRNVAYHSLEAAGLLMASFTPFFSSSSHSTAKTHFTTASSIVSGALLQAFNIVAPDRVPGQLVNLDDESLRDGSVIPNNTQVRTTVFVEKRALTEALQQAATGIEREEKNREEKNKDKPDMVNLSAAEKATIAANLGVAETATIANSEERSFMQPKSESPFLIRMALGKLILVGDPIEYLPRVQIESNSSQQSSSVVTERDRPQLHQRHGRTEGDFDQHGYRLADHEQRYGDGCGRGRFQGHRQHLRLDGGDRSKLRRSTVTFTAPSTVGAQSATLKINDSASGLPQTVNLSGTESSVELTPNSLSFPNQPVNKASSGQKVTVTNAGTAPLTIPENPVDGTDKGLFSLDTSKTQSDACGSTLPPHQSCGIYVIFTPTKAGSFGADLEHCRRCPRFPANGFP